MTLDDYLTRHYLPSRPDLSLGYTKLLRATVRKLGEFAKCPLPLEAIDRALLASWASQSLSGGLKPSTVNDRLRMVRTMLLAAYDDDFLRAPPRRVKRLRESPMPPEAWTIDQCRRLFDALGHQPGMVGDVAAADWWTALCATVFWTAARIGALLKAQAEHYEAGKGIVLAKQKNGRPLWCPLPATCCRQVERIMPAGGAIWKWPYHPRSIWTRFREIVESIGLPSPRTHGQLFYRLRRTSLSYCAAEDPLLAQRQADHGDVRTTMRHYVDPRIARQRSAVDVLPDPTDGAESPRLRVIG